MSLACRDTEIIKISVRVNTARVKERKKDTRKMIKFLLERERERERDRRENVWKIPYTFAFSFTKRNDASRIKAVAVIAVFGKWRKIESKESEWSEQAKYGHALPSCSTLVLIVLNLLHAYPSRAPCAFPNPLCLHFPSVNLINGQPANCQLPTANR